MVFIFKNNIILILKLWLDNYSGYNKIVSFIKLKKFMLLYLIDGIWLMWINFKSVKRL